MSQEIIISQVSIQNSATSYDLISLHQFLKIPSPDRHEMVKSRKVEFIDETGGTIKLIDGLRAITELIKDLRTEGKYMEFLASA